jgi:hypothetical protein
MPHSNFVHSSIVNPAKPKLKENESDKIDTITLDVPLLTRLLEFAREDIKSDEDLHKVITNMVNLKNQGTLGMDHYDHIAQIKKNDETVELESILKLAGLSE